MSLSGREHSRIGQFRVGRVIGEGTFGLVKIGTHILTQEKVAIKVLEKEKIASPEDLSRVRREIKILKNLRHPNIIQLYEIIEDKDNIYLIMEFASQGELFKYIVDNTKLQEKEACRLFQQIVNAMEYFHRLNIAHRDIKPENLFLDDRLNIKVGDFGLSNIFGQDTLLKTSCGSPCYAAPEMISGKPYSGVTVDIWASGVVLFAMLCGYLPFNYPEDQTTILFKEIRKGNYKVPSSVSREGKGLIKAILNIDHRARYTIEQIKEHIWYKLHENWQYRFPGVIVGLQKIPIDPYILQKVKSFGVDEATIIKELQDNRHNSNTSLYYLILNSEKSRGYNTTQDIASVRFIPELLSGYPVATVETQPQIDRNRRQIATGQYGSAPSLHEESMRNNQKLVQLHTEDAFKTHDFSKSMRGLTAIPPREQNILRMSQPGTVLVKETSKLTQTGFNPEFELYLSGSCDNGSVQVNTKPTESTQATSHAPKDISEGAPTYQTSQKFTPNIYNKIEISYITNNYGHGIAPLFPSSGSGNYSASARGITNGDQSVSLNESYAVESSNIRESLADPLKTTLHVSGSDNLQSKVVRHSPQAENQKQASETDLRLTRYQGADLLEGSNPLVETSIVKESVFKQENQYRSLHELTAPRHSDADIKVLAIANPRPEVNSLCSPRDATKSQFLPRGSKRDSGRSESKKSKTNVGSPAFPKRALVSRVNIGSGKLGSDKGSTGRITAAKLAGINSIKKDKNPLITLDAQSKISKKINSIFKQIGINIKTNKNSNLSDKKTVNSNSNNSIEVKKPMRDSTTSSVHDILKQLKSKRSHKGSLNSSEKSSTTALHCEKSKTLTSINTKKMVTSLLKPNRPETREVSLYQESVSSMKDEMTNKNGHPYNLLYDKAQMQKKPVHASIVLNSNDKVFASVYDAAKKLYVCQSPVNLSALSRKSPKELIEKIEKALAQLYKPADYSVSHDMSYGMTVKLFKSSFLIRVEALDCLQDIHTLAVYPKIVRCRATLAKHLKSVFDKLDL